MTFSEMQAEREAPNNLGPAHISPPGEGQPLKKVYICEKDSKQILVYDLAQNTHYRRDADLEIAFQHNF
jgi:hypothetical protein